MGFKHKNLLLKFGRPGKTNSNKLRMKKAWNSLSIFFERSYCSFEGIARMRIARIVCSHGGATRLSFDGIMGAKMNRHI